LILFPDDIEWLPFMMCGRRMAAMSPHTQASLSLPVSIELSPTAVAMRKPILIKGARERTSAQFQPGHSLLMSGRLGAVWAPMIRAPRPLHGPVMA
jgi:hypothetical protein